MPPLPFPVDLAVKVHRGFSAKGFPLVATEPGRSCGEGSPSIPVPTLSPVAPIPARIPSHPPPRGRAFPQWEKPSPLFFGFLWSLP